MDGSRSETTLTSDQQVECRNTRMLNIKPLVPRISDQVFTKAFDDDKHSITSGQFGKKLSPTLFFDVATSKTATEIGESVGTGDYPGFDRSWEHW